MLNTTLSTRDAYFTEDKDEAEIHMNGLSELFTYDLLEMRGKFYVQVYSHRDGAFLGYAKRVYGMGEQLQLAWGL